MRKKLENGLLKFIRDDLCQAHLFKLPNLKNRREPARRRASIPWSRANNEELKCCPSNRPARDRYRNPIKSFLLVLLLFAFRPFFGLGRKIGNRNRLFAWSRGSPFRKAKASIIPSFVASSANSGRRRLRRRSFRWGWLFDFSWTGRFKSMKLDED